MDAGNFGLINDKWTVVGVKCVEGGGGCCDVVPVTVCLDRETIKPVWLFIVLLMYF